MKENGKVGERADCRKCGNSLLTQSFTKDTEGKKRILTRKFSPASFVSCLNGWRASVVLLVVVIFLGVPSFSFSFFFFSLYCYYNLTFISSFPFLLSSFDSSFSFPFYLILPVIINFSIISVSVSLRSFTSAINITCESFFHCLGGGGGQESLLKIILM